MAGVRECVFRWAAMWHSNSATDGVCQHIIFENCLPVLFRTRRECRAWIEKHYGYIKHREDLRAQPYGWRLPRAVRVHIAITVT